MKNFLLTIVSVASLAAPGFLHAQAYDRGSMGQKDTGKNRPAQRSGEPGRPGFPTATNPLAPPQNVQPKPWEAKPWEEAQKDVRGEELKRNEARKTEERRRVGRKARKERLARVKEKDQALSYEDRVKQRQTRWQRHQLQSDRYATRTFP